MVESKSAAGADAPFAILDMMSATVLLTDTLGRVLWGNSASEVLLGCSRRTFVGTDFRDRLAECDEWYAHLASGAAVESARVFGRLLRAHPGAQPDDVRVQAVLTRLPEGWPACRDAGVLIEIVDVEETLHQDREWMNCELMDANRQLLRNLAHEIKNPLTPIRLSAERLAWKLHAKLTEEKDLQLLQRTTNTIIEQVDTLRQMVNDFREYARMPAASLVPLNLNEFMETVLQLYHDAGHAISFVPGEGLPEIDADPAQLRQVFHNLISNSLEAVTEGEPVRISIRTEALESKYHAGAIGAVKLSIEDNGPGFTDKILNAAFEPYVTTKPTGTGLGLPIVKKILDDHGAAIKLKNRSNEETGEILGASVEIVFKVSRLEHNPISN